MAKCGFFKHPKNLLIVGGSAMFLGSLAALASKPIALSISLQHGLTMSATASLATGLLTAGLIIAAAGLVTLMLTLFLSALRTRSRYVENSSVSTDEDYDPRRNHYSEYN